ncbi:hypothetical protein AB6848_06090 [Serratia proteamaculans]|uniref:DNA-directed RNA polymerase specialized sigma24 family protein n=1 Tax=Klebsiella oxytoca TaxID=571 RepID=A0A318F6W4_KLEOX|nr:MULTISPECIES: hypothetical protein [Enterobacteriaceae]EGC4559441.1 hypothetical protein [Escherichia coli]EKW9492730.1 hypothetical protein [Enterobacter hormaechei]HCD1870631.1 hypothetical protein [Enterobacter bugandensis]PXW32206.1 DNA-directed RNA polymerase specialized sigma24 family protein [Klebsiella oxytoca]QMR45561.1 hypothetical protein HV310_12830 [Citrobacter freundii]
MNRQIHTSTPWWAEIESLCHTRQLNTLRPEVLVKACRNVDAPLDKQLQGKLLEHLVNIARGFMNRRVRQDLPNGGRDVIEETIDILLVSILTPSSADGPGFEMAFFAKLRQRMVDRIRVATKAKNREEQESIDPETGATIEMPDWDQLSPEENVIINNLLAKLHHNHRKAFELHRLGYKYSSSDPTQSMAVMLDKTPKTVQSWVEQAHKQILDLLGSSK